MSRTSIAAILKVANKGYQERMSEGLPESVAKARKADSGDSLADFIVLEIAEVATGADAPLHEAIEALQRAQEDIQNVVDALEAACDGDGHLRKEN